MDELTYILEQHCSYGFTPADMHLNAVLIRAYGQPARDMILRKRAEWRAEAAQRQRRFQAADSRRPARGRHHDSWAIRERYVRVHGWALDRV